MNGELARVGLACGRYRSKAAARTCVGRTAGRNRGDTGLNREQVRVAPSVEWNIDHLLALDGLAYLCVRGAHLSGVLSDCDH